MEAKRLRNLTTGKLHTEMGHIYEDLELITGMDGLMTHMLPRAMRAIAPWLKEKVKDSQYWDDEYNPDATGEYRLPKATLEERAQFLYAYKSQPCPLEV